MIRFGLPLIAAAALLLAGCGSTSKIASWTNPEMAGTRVSSVLIIGAAREDFTRRLFEDELARQLATRGVRGITSYQHLDRETLQDRQAALSKIEQLGVDGVIVATAIDQRTEQVVTPGTTHVTGRGPSYSPSHRRRHWHDHYLRSYQVVTRPPTVTDFQVVTVETNLYGPGQEMIWSMRSETSTTSGQQLGGTIEEFVGLVVDNLAANGLI